MRTNIQITLIIILINMDILNILRELYADHRVLLRLVGRVLPGFPVLSGIKQGCPCSGTLFAIALDPFIRMLCMRISRRLGVFCAFADDLGAVLLSLKDSFPLLVEAFVLLRQASALIVNTTKTQVMPLYEHDQEELR